MKKIIRRNVFETNSSSSHSIVVTKNDTYVTAEELSLDNWDHNSESLHVYKDGVWRLWDTDCGFGRSPFRLLTTFEEKFIYALCDALGYEDPVSDCFKDEWDLMVSIAKDACPEIKSIDPDESWVDVFITKSGKQISDVHNWIEVINKDTDDEKYIWHHYYGDDSKDEEVEYLGEVKVPNIGCIDHQSIGLLSNFLNDRNITLKEFLTNKKYIIVIDGDEYDYWKKYKKTGLIDMDFIVSEYDTSGEDIEFAAWKKEQEENEES